jgi:hypothetical protein
MQKTKQKVSSDAAFTSASAYKVTVWTHWDSLLRILHLGDGDEPVDVDGPSKVRQALSVLLTVQIQNDSLPEDAEVHFVPVSVKNLQKRSKKSRDPARIRTWNLLIRSQTRYPLRHRTLLVVQEF